MACNVGGMDKARPGLAHQHFRDPQSVSSGSFRPKFPLSEEQLNDLTTYMLSLKRTT
jgi:cytochrome c1